MSRSRRKTPITGITTARSEAWDKALWHRTLRHAEKQRLLVAPESMPIDERHYGDPWDMSKDGKRYWGFNHPFSARMMRK